MADQPSPPPKPKPGSLRDRIAAFEKPAAAASSGPAPIPRPKPGGVSWKPVTSAPVSPQSGAESKVGGMSASDAKESITKGGSLKDRMAALQNRGGFGAPPPPAPKPIPERPKWKHPPVITHIDPDEDDAPSPRGESSKPPVPIGSVEDESSNIEDVAPAAGDGDHAEVDLEEEENQRRAAIAARMARLGGTRVGMAPMFGRPTVGKNPGPIAMPAEVGKATENVMPESPIEVVSSSHPIIKPSSEKQYSEDSSEDQPSRKNSELSYPTSEALQNRAPISMPLPSAPRRAGPPRKKSAKLPEPPVVVLDEMAALPEVVLPSGVTNVIASSPDADDRGDSIERQDEVVEKDTDSIVGNQPSVMISPNLVEEKKVDDSAVEELDTEGVTDGAKSEEPFVQREVDPHSFPEEELLEYEADAEVPGADDNPVAQEAIEFVAVPVEEPSLDEAAEEAARRKRVADKLAKMGGINPFALPPQRKLSFPVDDVWTSPAVSPTLQKRASLSREGVNSPPPLPPQRRQSTRKTSVDSTHHIIDSPQVLPSTRRDSVEAIITESDSPVLKRHSQDDRWLLGQGTEAIIATGIPEEFEEPKNVEASLEDDSESERSKINVDVNMIPGSVEENVYSGLSQPNDSSKHLDYAKIEGATSPPALVPRVPPVLNLSTRPTSLSVSAPPIDPVLVSPRSIQRVPSYKTSAPTRSVPPPRLIPQPADVEEESFESDVTNTPAQSTISSHQASDNEDAQPPRQLPPRTDVQHNDTNEDEPPPLPIPNRRPVGPRPTSSAHSRVFRAIPLSPPISTPVSDVESDYDEILPTLLRKGPITPGTPGTPPPYEVPLIVPPPVFEDASRIELSPLRQSHPTPHAAMIPIGSEQYPLRPSHLSVSEQEVLDEDEGDPIDPAFHGPSPRISTINLPTGSAPAQERAPDPEQDEQNAHRQTIAERMAKLGGIKFGSAPPLQSIRSPPRVSEQDGAQVDTDDGELMDAPAEEERARKERISAKLLHMGGMRIGMVPLSSGAPSPRASLMLSEQPPPPRPVRAVPPARPPPRPEQQDSDVELESDLSASFSTSEDGVKIEAEESEIEEVGHEEAREAEEIPPPTPSRNARRRGTGESEASQAPTISSTRPPVPIVSPSRKASIQSVGKKSSMDSGHSAHRSSAQKHQSEYVMVEEPSGFLDIVPPPLPPGRPSTRAPPARGVPPPPPPPASSELADSISSQWELPSVPGAALEFSDCPDLSLSWTEAARPASMSPPSPPLPTRQAVPAPQPIPVPTVERQLSSDELIAMWGRVGVQICEAATTLFEKSKKVLVGDGSYKGYVHAVLSEVPNAALPLSPSEYGYVIYVQTGGAVQKRLNDIMPGDVVELVDAKLKGHKGLQGYHQNVDEVVGIVSEFDPKKSKIRVFQANQHVGQQTVEAVSYRLEDLKSGTIKIYRVLEN